MESSERESPSQGPSKSKSTQGRASPSKSSAKDISKKETASSSEKPSVRSLVSVDSIDEFFKAKSYLMTASAVTEANLYDHLTELIGKILEGRPENVVDYVEDLSIWLKQNKLQYKEDTLINVYESGPKFQQARKDRKLFQGGAGDVSGFDEEEEDEVEETFGGDEGDDTLTLNLQEEIFFFEQAGLSLNRNEVYRINLSLRSLMKKYPLYNLRFWGKIIGTERNYVIIEADLKEGADFETPKAEVELEEEEEIVEVLSRNQVESVSVMKKDDEEDVEPALPTPKVELPYTVETESFREGVNAKIYFVSVAPDYTWTKLPLVTPAQIKSARLIRKYFTGRLDAPVLSYPPFPGKEINLLRAQIARISAATQIAPTGFFIIEEENEAMKENDQYEEIPVIDLANNALNNWVHRFPYLLPQGRCTWVKPTRPASLTPSKDEDAEVEPETEEEDEFQEEIGPPMFTPLSEDISPEGLDLWLGRLSPSTFPNFAVAVVNSLVWPGAYAMARHKKVANVYIGYGVKFTLALYNPPPPPLIMNEYPLEDGIIEIADPTPDEEDYFKQTIEETVPMGGEEEEEING